jgi:hypothetical protein
MPARCPARQTKVYVESLECPTCSAELGFHPPTRSLVAVAGAASRGAMVEIDGEVLERSGAGGASVITPLAAYRDEGIDRLLDDWHWLSFHANRIVTAAAGRPASTPA